MKAIAIIVAGGTSSRAKSQIPKQFVELAGKPIIQHSIDVFENHPNFEKTIVALNEEFLDFSLIGTKVIKTIGGSNRSESVANCLSLLKNHEADYVFIHDAARPGLCNDIINRLIEKLSICDGSFPSLKVTDALWRSDSHGQVLQSVNRESLHRAQTPQAFQLKKFILAFDGRDLGHNYLDDVEIAVASGLKIEPIEGNERLGKVTYPEDFNKIEQFLSRQDKMIRTGMGFDAHRFCEGEFVTICGEKLKHSLGLEGHSDADVAWHALVDAILGAIGAGDIGNAFPPSEKKWKNAPSSIFLEFAAKKLSEFGGRINNIDLTIVCEAPKIGPYREKLAKNTATLLGIDLNQVNIKATTTEKMGFTGRKEGIAAYAIATIEA